MAVPENERNREVDLRCLMCGRPYKLKWATMQEIGYTRCNYCEVCLERGIRLLRDFKKNMDRHTDDMIGFFTAMRGNDW